MSWSKIKEYYTCTLQGLSLKRDEFLEKVIQKMENRGFSKIDPSVWVSPSKGPTNLLEYYWINSDVLLESKRNGWIALRVKKHDENNLRVGYHYQWRIPYPNLKSFRGILYLLGIIAWAILVVMIGVFIVIKFGFPIMSWQETSNLPFFILFFPFTAILFLIVFITFIPIIPYTRRKKEHMHEEIKNCLIQITESLGGKQITPFKKTTINLED